MAYVLTTFALSINLTDAAIGEATSGFFIKSKVNLTSSAVTGFPSVQVTSFRK